MNRREALAALAAALPMLIGARTAVSGPEDWHRLALFGNWDVVDGREWHWIASRPDCDRATALAIFWMSTPEYYLDFATRDAVPEINRVHWDLEELIRTRWLAGVYTRARFAFDLERDCWPRDFAELERRYGERVAERMPVSMRGPLAGRRIAQSQES
jgi:hypothetical protein